FEGLTKGKVSYTKVVVLTVAFSYIVSNFGISTIISIASPVLSLLYPVVLVMILLNFFGSRIKNNNIYIFAAAFALAASAAEVLCGFGLPLEFIHKLPFGSFQCGWVVPAIIGGIIGKFVPASERSLSFGKNDEDIDAI
ncbi:MAG: branched-chain amino acid transport system II carrier protein, partial [Anaerotignum sp.]